MKVLKTVRTQYVHAATEVMGLRPYSLHSSIKLVYISWMISHRK